MEILNLLVYPTHVMTTRLFIARHGKTMFNTIGRAQGWSDTPLTAEGERGIRELGRGLREAQLDFQSAYTSDLGRTILTLDIILEEMKLSRLPHTRDKRIREWCFGSMDGGFDVDLFHGILPRIFNRSHKELSYQEMAEGIYEADTAGWAETWEQLSGRILDGFTSIAKQVEAGGGGDVLVVSHGMTIGTFLSLIDPDYVKSTYIANGSITQVTFEDGAFTIETIGDLSYREKGAELLALN
ncbi:histidine phosphatase family protein [Streptococcus hillyeri]|uniref:Histidine phosphatase family protein n=2 Tax=Streptococcus hillyeri TaxID=2282420 RepID=A0A3L9DRY7_9STRE|nr:histidine phosphatase family protein [Streptococcus hillyeri]RLY02783.1 histidine phosphatase family protein [Streptococcus hillyeri]